MRRWINLCESVGDAWDDIEALVRRHPHVSAAVDYDGDQTIDLNSLEANVEGQGHGSAFMRDLCALADAEDLFINLQPSGFEDDPATYEKLVGFYERFGFYEIDHGAMARAPGQHHPTTVPSSPDSLPDLIRALHRDGLKHIEQKPEQWLVHFSGYAEEISTHGFTQGTPLSHVGWKGAWGSGNGPGFNFACAADDEQAIEFWSQHTPCAVVFRAEGVTCWHKDGFDQVIFWGPSAKRPMFVLETLDDGPWEMPADDATWAVKMVDGKPVDSFGTGDLWTLLNKIMQS